MLSKRIRRYVALGALDAQRLKDAPQAACMAVIGVEISVMAQRQLSLNAFELDLQCGCAPAKACLSLGQRVLAAEVVGEQSFDQHSRRIGRALSVKRERFYAPRLVIKVL